MLAGRQRSLSCAAGVAIIALLGWAVGCQGGLNVGPSPDGGWDGSHDARDEEAGHSQVDGDAAGDGGDGVAPFDGPLCVFFDDDDSAAFRAYGNDFYAPYVFEILGHAGLAFATLTHDDVVSRAPLCPVLVLPYDVPLSPSAIEAVTAQVEGGGTLVAIGGPSYLSDLLGVVPQVRLDEGYLDLSDSVGELETPPLPLHVFEATPASPDEATVLASFLDRFGEPTELAGLTRRSFGLGEAYYLACDLFATLITIRQGRPVVGDGEPAQDGTADIDDGILKVDDGMALDWALDRSVVAGHSLFAEPVADHLVELFIQIILSSATRQAEVVPLVWYWPSGLDAVAVLSHDTDQNDPAMAQVLLSHLAALEVSSTWCFIRYPETYPAELVAQVAEAGHEVALHYDAHTGTSETLWGESYFSSQLAWLEGLSGIEVVTNKNHYLRWEGWVDFYRWCESAGIQADQSRGPSKMGNMGFLFGTCHPYFAVDDADHDNRIIDVLSINHLAWDPVYLYPTDLALSLLDVVALHYGVAHILIHPSHILQEGVADAMGDIVRHGREQGMQLWTVRQVNDWERARRQIAVDVVASGRFHLSSPQPLAGVEVLLAISDLSTDVTIAVDGTPVSWAAFSFHGVQTARIALDVGPSPTEVVVARN